MRLAVRLVALSLMVAVTACDGPGTAGPTAPAPTAGPSVPAGRAPGTPAVTAKVLLIAEENHDFDQIIGNPAAPYLNELAVTYGSATHLDAGYPPGCPSLAAYILLTSGRTDGICDDRAPRAHPLAGDDIFQQVAQAGLEWRSYAESAPGPCATANTADGRYLVRHVPATYYVSERSRCQAWAVPMGGPDAGAMHEDVTRGLLPAFGFVTPDACSDMHGAPPCPQDRVGTGDRWLKGWLPQILAGPDYRAGRLTIIITWDEGTGTDNHIPTLVISPTTRRIATDLPFTHCSTLRTVEELLRVPLLGCAATAASMADAFRL